MSTPPSIVTVNLCIVSLILTTSLLVAYFAISIKLLCRFKCHFDVMAIINIVFN